MKRYGLFIGVNEYRDGAIENLRCAVQDAASLSGVFEHRLDFAECALLTNPRASEVTERLEQFQARLQPGDLFVFYFAGHGKSHVNGHVLLLNDCRLNTLGDPHPVGILGVKSLRSLTDEWVGVSRALIFDACRRSLGRTRDSGEGSGFNGPGWRDCLTTKGAKASTSPAQRQFGALNSCQDEGLAVELERHGVFTQALMDVVKVRADGGRGVALDPGMVAEVGQRMDALCREAGHALGQRPEHTGDAVEILPVRSVSTEPSTRGVDSKLAKRIQAQPDTLVPTRADTRTKDLQAKSERIPKNPPIPLVIEPLPPELARRIKERVDDRAWTAATGSHTEASYAEYLERHPKGAHIVEATKRLKWIKLKANLLWLAVYGPVAMFAGVMLRLVWNWLRA